MKLDLSALSQRPPHTYQPGRLLSQVAREFQEFDCYPQALHHVQFIAPGDKLTFGVTERVEKSFLTYTVVAHFEYLIAGSVPGRAEIQLRHSGGLRRTGISGRVKFGGKLAEMVVRQVETDQPFVRAILPLDFQRFYLVQDDHGWRVNTCQVGAAWVAITFPPVRRYVPLGRDQVDSLVATFRRLQLLLGS